MMFDFLANMDDNVIAALQRYVKDFGIKGLTKYQGESPGIAQTEMVVVCTRLDDLGRLLHNSVNDVLDGLQKCQHEQFKKTFADIRSMRGNDML